MPERAARLPPLSSPTRALREFLATEAAGGVLLVLAAVVALVWANSPWQESYATLWHTDVGVHVGRWSLELDLRHWVNDGLMAVFFLVVGLEVKRELVLGELRDRRRAVLPIVAAVGGMVVPALFYLGLNPAGAEASGWGIPMATDIAFAVGVLALVAPAIPPALRLFLLTLAIVDDIGAILVIAVVYSSAIELAWVGVALVVVGCVVGLRRLGVTATPWFVLLGGVLWVAVYESGVHPTVAGVVMGLLVPATPALTREIVRSRTDELLDVFTPEAARDTTRLARQAVSPLEWLEHQLHGWSSLVIVPLFALANAGVELTADAVDHASSSTVTIGVVVGLVLGKTVGISAATWGAVRLGRADLPTGASWRQLVGVAALAGIGFTVSLFIAGLAFDDPALVDEAKIGVLAASVVATLTGYLLLRSARRPTVSAAPP
ncbi:MAG: Na+/H+ antiporter NhaA [Acidimicrobiales bacterium]